MNDFEREVWRRGYGDVQKSTYLVDDPIEPKESRYWGKPYKEREIIAQNLMGVLGTHRKLPENSTSSGEKVKRFVKTR